MIHEFRTDEHESADTDAALQEFTCAVFGEHHLPEDSDLPWCVELALHPAAPDIKMYLAKAVTNRASKLTDPSHLGPPLVRRRSSLGAR
jgi:hypothetical protein